MKIIFAMMSYFLIYPNIVYFCVPNLEMLKGSIVVARLFRVVGYWPKSKEPTRVSMTFYIPDKSIKSNSTISDAVRVRGTNYIKVTGPSLPLREVKTVIQRYASNVTVREREIMTCG